MLRIREEEPEDRPAIAEILERAFGRPAEANLVEQLRAGGHLFLSLLASEDCELCGCVFLSRLRLRSEENTGSTVAALALAPIAVAPEFQDQGIGSSLIERALEICRERGEAIVTVLGDPDYYQRFGFSSETGQRIRSPFSGPHYMAACYLPEAIPPGAIADYPAPFSAL